MVINIRAKGKYNGKKLDSKFNTGCRIINSDSVAIDNHLGADSNKSNKSFIKIPNVPNKHDMRVVNLSYVMLSPQEINTLSKGLGFTVYPKNIPFGTIICNIEGLSAFH